MAKSNKRNVTIDIKTAKDWYKQGGSLREVALQAFDEDELRSLEYGDIIEYNGMKGYVVGMDNNGNPTALLSVDFWVEDWYDAIIRKFSGGWHLPNIDFFKIYREGIIATAKRYKWAENYPYLWSSSECSSNYAWYCNYYNGNCDYNSKGFNHCVRAVSLLPAL